MESNDSPEIPDREETSDIPGLPSGAHMGGGPKNWVVSLRNARTGNLQLKKEAAIRNTGQRKVNQDLGGLAQLLRNTPKWGLQLAKMRSRNQVHWLVTTHGRWTKNWVAPLRDNCARSLRLKQGAAIKDTG